MEEGLEQRDREESLFHLSSWPGVSEGQLNITRVNRYRFVKGTKQAQPPVNDRLKNWATIARGAARTDRDMTLALKLAEIQKNI